MRPRGDSLLQHSADYCRAERRLHTVPAYLERDYLGGSRFSVNMLKLDPPSKQSFLACLDRGSLLAEQKACPAATVTRRLSELLAFFTLADGGYLTYIL